MATRICGWCNTKCHLTSTGEVTVTEAWGWGDRKYVADASYKCDGCGRLSVVSWITTVGPYDATWKSYGRTGEPESYETQHWYPVPGSQVSFEDVPDEIASAASEAWLCHSAGAERGAVSLARAVVESTAKAKGVETGNLEKKIDALADTGLIRRAVADQAHEVRHMGNGAAHGDLGSPVTTEEAEECLNLMGEVLNEVWQAPARAARLREAREARKAAH